MMFFYSSFDFSTWKKTRVRTGLMILCNCLRRYVRISCWRRRIWFCCWIKWVFLSFFFLVEVTPCGDHPIPSWSLSLIWGGGDDGVISVSYGIRNTGWLCFWNWNWNFDLNVLTLIWPLIWFLFLSFFRQICWDRNSMQGLKSGNSTYFVFFLC